MTDELELETYLSISPKKYEIYLFDKRNLINLYKQSSNIKNQNLQLICYKMELNLLLLLYF